MQIYCNTGIVFKLKVLRAIKNLKKTDMRCTKSIELYKRLSKKSAFYKMWLLWKKDVKWDDKTRKERLICVWFSLSLFFLGVAGTSFLLLPAVINFIFAIIAMIDNNIDIKE